MRNALIVDDSAWIHSLVQSQLGKEFSLQSAFDGLSGLSKAESINPEFILLDIDLPDLHGFDVCRQLKASDSTRSIPVIFLTSAKGLDARVGGLNIGACDYITKPFEPLELKARVRAVVREKHNSEDAGPIPVMDTTTGLFNRRYLEARVEGEIARARRSAHALACLLVKCEFKLPDSNNRTRFENVICHVAQAVRQACRKEDVICRHSIDTIAVLAVTQDRAAAQTLAERVQDYVKECEVTTGNYMPAMKVSIGVGLSRFSTGLTVVHDATEALAQARRCVFGKIVVGSEIVQLQMAG